MADEKHEIECPECHKRRFVSKGAMWYIKTSKNIVRCKSCATLGNKGRRGIPLPEEHKKKISLSNSGKVRTEEQRKHYINCRGGKRTGFVPKSAFKKGTYTDAMRKGSLAGAKALSERKTTSIEKIVYDELDRRGVVFEKQKIINGKFLVDAYVPSTNTVIEVDGSYWHSLDRVVKKDKAENAYLTKCGFNLIRLPESDIRSGSFTERMG